MIRILTGDCRDVLPTLEAGSVHCVVTSPPYYGLRDYGTAQWQGGDAGCDHSMAIRAGDPVPPACRRCQKCGKMCRTQWTSATSVRSECDQCGVATDYNDVDSRGTSWGVVRKTGHADTGDLVWALPRQRYPGDICRCGARRIDRQIGLEASPEAYLQTMVEVFRHIRRVLRDDGCVFCNMGDGYQDKQLLMMPARLALALQADGWWLRSDIIWAKPNPMPESVTDRPTSAHEHVFLLSKRSRYYYDSEAVREEQSEGTFDRFEHTCRVSGPKEVAPGQGIKNNRSFNAARPRRFLENGRNLRNVWTIATAPFPAAHFATFPPELAERCIRAGSRPGDTILDPFSGAGTALLVADRLGRDAIGIDLSHAYVEMARERLQADCPLFADITDAPVASEDAYDRDMRDLFAEAAE